MHNRFKNKGVFALSLMLIIAAGCSGSNPESASNSPGPSNSASNSQEPTTTPSGDKVKIEYFQMKPETVDVVDQLIQKFEEQNPNIMVEQNNVPNPENVWTMRVSTDDAPDAFTHYPHNSVFQKMSQEGRVVDLTNDPLLTNVSPAIVELSKIDGKNYLVPIGLATLGVYYNTEIFEQLNLQPPQTYDEFIQVAEKLKAAGITPFYFHDKDWNGIRQEVVYKMGQQLTNIEQFLDDVMNGKAHITDNPEFKPFAQKILDLRQYGQKDNLGTGYDDALREFASGNAAMWFTGIWAIKAIKEANPDLNFAMFPVPTEKAEDVRTQVSVDTAIGIPVNAKHKDEARKFVEFMASKESVQTYLQVGGYPAAIQGVTNDVQEMKRLNELIEAGKVYPTIERLWPPGTNGEVGKATQEMFATNDVDKYLKDLDDIFFNRFNQ